MKTYDFLKIELVCEIIQKEKIKILTLEEILTSLEKCPLYVTKFLKCNLSFLGHNEHYTRVIPVHIYAPSVSDWSTRKILPTQNKVQPVTTLVQQWGFVSILELLLWIVQVRSHWTVCCKWEITLLLLARLFSGLYPVFHP